MDRRLLTEAYRRFGAGAAEHNHALEQAAAVLATRFDRQLDFIASPAKRKAAFCTRRAGKTEADAAYLLTEALAGPDRLCLFVAKTRGRAMDLTWKAVERLCETNGVDSKPNLTTARRTLANGSEIRWTGADNLEQLKKKRGDKLWLVIIDEAQDFEFSVLTALVDDIFGPGLEDLGGTICLTGTPGIVCSGYWWELTRPDAQKRTQGWEVHRWSVLDNPWMMHMRQRLPELKLERGWTDETPTYRREWLGEWVNDFGALFYAFDSSRNLHSPDDQRALPQTGWSHVLGLDLGLRDAMGLVAWGFHPELPELYERWSWKKSGILIDELVARIRQFEAEPGVNIVARVADTGGLGALIVEEIAKRHQMRFEAAKKTEKYAHVELFNDDMRSGRVKLLERSPLQEEMAVLPKDPDSDPTKPPKEHSGFDNHCCDAGLYAWRRAWHFLHERPVAGPAPGSPEFYEAEAQEHERQLLERFTNPEQQEAWWDQ